MDVYEVRRIRSGAEEDFIWVSIWFRREAGPLDVLHVVCSPTDGIYLERHDQSIACYGGTRRVLIHGDRAEFELAPEGARSIAMPRGFVLVIPEKVAGWKKACRLLRGTTGFPSGRTIRFA
jgi:hypothetical protein